MNTSTASRREDGGEGETVFSVSRLCREAGDLLDAHFGRRIQVRGEISDFKDYASGHWYFNLCDENAKLNCAMFSRDNLRAPREPADGEEVVLCGRLNIYGPQGRFQLIAERMEIGQVGEMSRAYEALKAKLHREGLFDLERRRPLPSFPRHIALITSDRGAAMHDVLNVLQRRAPFIAISLLPVAVQGDAAAHGIREALRLAGRAAEELPEPPELVLLCRGGGSAEDLWAFNDEKLVRAVAACPLPVVTGIGHQIDVSLCDLAADCHAPTPSAAAEQLSPDRAELLEVLGAQADSMLAAVRKKHAACAARLRDLRARLRHPRDRLQRHQQWLDERQQRMGTDVRHRMERAQKALADDVGLLRLRMARILERKRQRREMAAASLQLTDPRNVLRRGYAILTRDDDNAVVDDSARLRKGERLRAQLARGAFRCSVEEIEGGEA